MEAKFISLKELKEQEPERYFQEVLEKREFDKLKKLVIDSEYEIDWILLAEKGVIGKKNGTVTGIYWNDSLYLEETSIKSLGKFKRIKKSLYCYNAKQLEDLGILEEIGESIDIRGTSLSFQKKVLGNIKDKKLKIGDKIMLGGNIRGIDKLLEQEGDMGIISVRGTSGVFQIKTLYRKIKGDLKCRIDVDNWILFIFNSIYLDESLDFCFDGFQKVFGKDIREIQDDNMRKLSKQVLLFEYENKRKEIEERVEKIMKENEGLLLDDNEKKVIRDKIKKMDIELIAIKGKIDSFI